MIDSGVYLSFDLVELSQSVSFISGRRKGFMLSALNITTPEEQRNLWEGSLSSDLPLTWVTHM